FELTLVKTHRDLRRVVGGYRHGGRRRERAGGVSGVVEVLHVDGEGECDIRIAVVAVGDGALTDRALLAVTLQSEVRNAGGGDARSDRAGQVHAAGALLVDA